MKTGFQWNHLLEPKLRDGFLSQMCSHIPSVGRLYIYLHMAVSENSGFSPQIIHFNRVFHYFHHPFWGTPILETPKSSFQSWSHLKNSSRLTSRRKNTRRHWKWKKHRVPRKKTPKEKAFLFNGNSPWRIKHEQLVGGWTNPFEKYIFVKLDHETSGIGVKIKNIWVATT